MPKTIDPSKLSIKAKDIFTREDEANPAIVIEMLNLLGFRRRGDTFYLKDMPMEFDAQIDRIKDGQEVEEYEIANFEHTDLQQRRGEEDEEYNALTVIDSLVPKDLFIMDDAKYALSWPNAAAIYDYSRNQSGSFLRDFKKYLLTYDDKHMTRKEIYEYVQRMIEN